MGVPTRNPDQEMMETSIPDESLRAALHFLAAAIENADEERSDGWCLLDIERRFLRSWENLIDVCASLVFRPGRTA